jgi:hypothetical protein
MKIGKVSVLLVACATAPAYAQTSAQGSAQIPAQVTDWGGAPMCDTTNLDRTRNVFTVIGPAPGANQQCFIHVVPREQAAGPGQMVEGDYRITLSGGAGGGGGGVDRGSAGHRAADAVPGQVDQHLNPGMYRLTIGTGGPGGIGCTNVTRGQDGGPTGISDATTGAVVAGVPRAEYYVRTIRSDTAVAGTQPARTPVAATQRAAQTPSSAAGAGTRALSPPLNAPLNPPLSLVAAGGAGGPGGVNCGPGGAGGHGFISIRPAS